MTTTDRLRTFPRDLPVKLTEEECQTYGRMLAERVQEYDLIERQKQLASKDFSNRLSRNRGEQSRLADARASQTELRQVICFDRWHANTIETLREDTGDVIEVRPATDADAQPGIPGLDAPPREVGEVVASSFGDGVFVGAEDENDDEPEEEPDANEVASFGLGRPVLTEKQRSVQGKPGKPKPSKPKKED